MYRSSSSLIYISTVKTVKGNIGANRHVISNAILYFSLLVAMKPSKSCKNLLKRQFKALWLTFNVIQWQMGWDCLFDSEGCWPLSYIWSIKAKKQTKCYMPCYLFKMLENSFVDPRLFFSGSNESKWLFEWQRSPIPVSDEADCWQQPAESHYVSEAFWRKRPSWHLGMCSLFNYSQPFRRRAGWLRVGAAEAASAQLLSLTGRHLIHSPDTQPAPR